MGKRPLRSAHVDSERGLRGGEVQVFLLLRGLHACGHDVALFCPPGSRSAEEARRGGIACECVRMRNHLDLPSVVRLAVGFRRQRVDVVHLHTARALWLGGLAAKLVGLPAITTRRMDRPIKRSHYTRMLYERLTCRVIAISPTVAKRLAEGEVSRDRIVVIPSAVDPSRLCINVARDAMREKLGVARDQKVLLVVAALVRGKGVDLLLQALALLADEGLRPVLWVAGDGPERLALKSQAEALGVASQVEFLGQRQDTGDLLSACDLFVTPSREEGLGVAALEAMAAGRAVVATAVGGLRDAVVDGVTGMLVPPEEPRALAMSIGRLLRDDELRRRFGRAGPAHIAEGFLPEQMVTAHEQLYEAVMREWHAGRRAC